MTAAFTLILGLSLANLPFVFMQLPDVEVQRLRQQGAGGDGSVRLVEISRLSVCFMEEKGIAGV